MYTKNEVEGFLIFNSEIKEKIILESCNTSTIPSGSLLLLKNTRVKERKLFPTIFSALAGTFNEFVVVEIFLAPFFQ